MAKPLVHARSSARRWGGPAEAYLELHDLMDSSKAMGVAADNRHRALTHHAAFAHVAEAAIGHRIQWDRRPLAHTRDVVEQHCLEDFAGRYVPTALDYWRQLKTQPWMRAGTQNAVGPAPHPTQLAARRFGGQPGDYDRLWGLVHYGAASLPPLTAQALTHHTYGAWLCQRALGVRLATADGPVDTLAVARWLIERALGREIPAAGEWLAHVPYEPWMTNGHGSPPPSARAVLAHRARRRGGRPGRPAAYTRD